MNNTFAISGCTIFDGKTLRENSALLIEAGKITALVGQDNIPNVCNRVEVNSGYLLPGFIDLQVNGGGACQFNNDPSCAAIEKICSAHIRLGTIGLLPTFITDSQDKVQQAIDAAIKAQTAQVAGFLGLHLEGPHLAVDRKGAHDATLVRPMQQQDLEILQAAAKKLNILKLTIAPEAVSCQQITALANSGIIVSLGHSNASYETAKQAAKAGASCVTHLFNAMSPLLHRSPGLVGASLDLPELYAGIIADGIHVHPAVIRTAVAAKAGVGKLFLISDAMAVAGSRQNSFTLGDRKIYRKEGALRLEDGTLAGADLTMAKALQFMVREIGLDIAQASRMTSTYPANCIGLGECWGHLNPGAIANMVHLDANLQVCHIWLAGKLVQLKD